MNETGTGTGAAAWSMPELVKTGVALALFLVSLYDILINDLDDAVIRGVFLGFALFYAFAFYKGGSRERSRFAIAMDMVAGLLGLAVAFYIVFDFENVFSRAGSITTLDYVVAAVAIVLVLEATRRTAYQMAK